MVIGDFQLTFQPKSNRIVSQQWMKLIRFIVFKDFLQKIILPGVVKLRRKSKWIMLQIMNEKFYPFFSAKFPSSERINKQCMNGSWSILFKKITYWSIVLSKNSHEFQKIILDIFSVMYENRNLRPSTDFSEYQLFESTINDSNLINTVRENYWRCFPKKV